MYLGSYAIEADAALAFDEAAKLLRGPDTRTNFDTMKAYKRAKKRDLKKRGVGNDLSADEIQSKVAMIVSRKYSSGKANQAGSVIFQAFLMN